MTEDNMNDARAVHTKAHEWINTLMTSGVSETAAVVALQQALVERLLIAGGTVQAAKFLRGQAEQVERYGPDFIHALKA